MKASPDPRKAGVVLSSKGLRWKVRLVNVGRELVSEFSTASFAEGELVSQRENAPSFLIWLLLGLRGAVSRLLIWVVLVSLCGFFMCGVDFNCCSSPEAE